VDRAGSNQRTARLPTGSRMSQTKTGPDGKLRCGWSISAPELLHYHDREWGFPVADDRRLFEKLCLESFQSGLSWRMILAKRDNFRTVFHQCDFDRIARFTHRDVERLVGTRASSAIGARLKRSSTTRRSKELVRQEGSFAAYLWRHEPAPKTLANPQGVSKSAASIALSKDLKKRGWSFVGPTTVHAFMQAMGLINDHAEECVVRIDVEKGASAI
jgi:DNA-3-methyladenine glycosylase I